MTAFTSSAEVFFSTNVTMSTTETLGVGTRIEKPSSFPLSSGMTRCNALAAPVEVGIMDTAAARARRKSLCGKSKMTWSFVYEWIVVMVPLTILKLSFITFAMGARQLVVQEAFEM